MNEANAKKSPNLLQRLLKRREMVTFVLLVVVLIVAMMLSDSFRDVGYLFKSATKTIELAMTALPMTFIIIAGMIDLSVPSAMCCSATMAAVAYSGGMDMGLAIVVGLLGGADINGGSGSIVGTFLAVLLVIILKTGLIVANVTADAQMFVMGLILLISIIIPNVGQVLKERKDK